MTEPAGVAEQTGLVERTVPADQALLAEDPPLTRRTQPDLPMPVRAADRDMAVLLSQALRLLGQSGRPVAASRIAGKAWWAARAEGDERAATRINGVMHYLAALPPESDDDPASLSPGTDSRATDQRATDSRATDPRATDPRATDPPTRRSTHHG